MHKFGYTEEMLQTRLIEDIQDSYQKLESSTSNIESKIDDYEKPSLIFLWKY